MPGVHIPQVVECLFRAQLRKEDTIRLHSQARLQQLFWSDPRKTLTILAVEEPHVIDVPVEDQFLGVFNGYEPFFSGNLANESLGPGGFAGTGGTGDKDVPAADNRQTHEGLILLGFEESRQLGLYWIQSIRCAASHPEGAAFT